LGKKNLSLEELEVFRKILVETGALKYSEDLAKKYSEDSFEVLEQIDTQSAEGKNFLYEIAKYVGIRNY